ncbi:MAG TPA: ABC transporter ATP-binding protein [Gaiellaceae bacterium]
MRGTTWRLLRPFRLRIAAAALCVIVSTLIQLAGPALAGYAVDHGIRNHDRGTLDRVALVFLALALAKPLVVHLQVRLMSRSGERFLGSLRAAAYERLQQLPLAFFEGERAGVLVSRLTADVQSLTQFVRQVLVEIVGSTLQLVLTAAIMVALAPLLFAVTLVATPILVLSLRYFHRNARPAYLAIRDAVANTLTAIQEGLTGMKVVQAFRREETERERFRSRSRAQVTAWKRAARVNIRFFPSVALAQAVATAAVLVAGGLMYQRGHVSIGALTAFLLYLTGLFDPVTRITEWIGEFQSGRAALAKIVGLIETPTAVPEVDDPVELPAGALRVDSVTFAYDGDPVLHSVELEIEPGEHVALVGATGAGKSTLAKLLSRQYDPGIGSIELGGVDLRAATLASVRSRIALVPQEGHLFSGSLADNVRLARPEAGDGEVERALDEIGALDRFATLPEGLATDVQTRGVRLSAGERQLVGLARVALVDPDVLILDEATSSLDPGTERAVERALGRLTEGRTVITIAHRLSTAQRADRVVVLERGRLVEQGSHEQLLSAGGRYAALWDSWRSGGGALADAAEPV